MNRVVITGRGCLSSLGLGVAAFEHALQTGACGIAPLEFPGTPPVRMALGARVRGYVPGEHFDEKRLAQLDLFSQFALVAAREALAEARLPESVLRARTAAVIGTGVGGEATIDEMSERVYRHGQRVHPLTIPRSMGSAAASQVSMELGLTGPTFGVTSACASANHAVGLARGLIQAGLVDAALAGGADACFSRGHVLAWEALRVAAPDACRPFSRGRQGMVLGEGAGLVVLEREDHAQARGAAVLAELAGFGMSSDAADLVNPQARGMAAAISAALADARLAPEEIDYVNAHGTGTRANDAAECQALHAALGPQARRVAVSSTKSAHGHALGASGGLELVATIMALRQGVIPPTLNFLEPDPECEVDCTPNRPAQREVRAALSSSFAFGGLNAVLALRRHA